MKNLYFLILLTQILAYNLCGQVATPKGTSVEYNTYPEASVEDLASWEAQAAAWLYAHERWDTIVEKTGNATATYNCHSWAWYKYEGGSNNYWINAPTNYD